MEAFLAAARDGEFERLFAVLDPDIVLRADGGAAGAASRIVRGAAPVAAQATGFSRLGLANRLALVNGNVGIVARRADGRLFSVIAFSFADGRIATDRAWRRSAITLAERKAALGAAPAYLYLLTFESVPFGGRYGSVHGTEMPLFYHNLDKWPIAGTSVAAQALAGQIAGAYIAFARTGKPTVPGFGDWPAYNATGRATMIFDTDTRVENAPHQRLLDLVQQYAVAPPAPRR